MSSEETVQVTQARRDDLDDLGTFAPLFLPTGFIQQFCQCSSPSSAHMGALQQIQNAQPSLTHAASNLRLGQYVVRPWLHSLGATASHHACVQKEGRCSDF